jgi:hypothetical protein
VSGRSGSEADKLYAHERTALRGPVGLGANRGPTTQGTRDRPSSSVAAYAVRNRGPRGDEPSSTGLLGLNKAGCSLSKRSMCTTRALRTPVALALLLRISLFDEIELLSRGVPPCLIVGN